MKLRYLFSTILASALMFVGCTQESIESFENIKLDKTYLVIPDTGGEVTLSFKTTIDWKFADSDEWPNVIEYEKDKKDENGNPVVKSSTPSWLTLKEGPMGGQAGEYNLVFSAPAIDGGREIEIEIKAGVNSQFFRVRQGKMTAVEATCADVIAGADGKSFIVQGVCTSIASDYYGNWYMNDGTGEIYIYGTKNADGEYDWDSFNIEVGDSVKVEGPKTTYKDVVELVDVSVVKVIKSLLKLPEETYMAETDGDTFEVKLAYKGKGVFYNISEDCASWVSVDNMDFKSGTPSKLIPNPADTAIVTVSVLPNDGKTREGLIVFSSSNGESTSIGNYKFSQAGVATISEVLESAKGASVVVAGQVMAKHGNGFIVADNTAAIYVYGSSLPLAVGNNVSLAGQFDNYYGTLQVKNVTVKKNDNATEAPEHPAPMNLQYQADYELLGDYKNSTINIQHLKIRGTLTKDDYGYYVEVGTAANKTCLYKTTADYTALVGKTIVVTGYIMGYNSPYKYYQVIETSVTEATDELPAITLKDIKDVVAGEATYTVSGVVVAAANDGYVIGDATGNLFVYGKGHGRKVMEKVRLTGTASHYQTYKTNTLQLAATSTDVVASGCTWTYAPTVLTGETLEAMIGKDSYATEVQVTGTVVKSGNNLDIIVDGTEKQARFKYVVTADYEKYADKKVVLKGYVMGTYQRLSILPYSVEEVK